MVMGYGQIYNHQDDNSAEIRFDLKNQIADIRAVKKIKKGQEIFVNYGPNYFKNKQKITIESPAQPSSQIKDQIPPIKPPTMMETPVVEIKDKQVYRPL
jgi:SET domain-containing protein